MIVFRFWYSWAFVVGLGSLVGLAPASFGELKTQVLENARAASVQMKQTQGAQRQVVLKTHGLSELQYEVALAFLSGQRVSPKTFELMVRVLGAEVADIFDGMYVFESLDKKVWSLRLMFDETEVRNQVSTPVWQSWARRTFLKAYRQNLAGQEGATHFGVASAWVRAQLILLPLLDESLQEIVKVQIMGALASSKRPMFVVVVNVLRDLVLYWPRDAWFWEGITKQLFKQQSDVQDLVMLRQTSLLGAGIRGVYVDAAAVLKENPEFHTVLEFLFVSTVRDGRDVASVLALAQALVGRTVSAEVWQEMVRVFVPYRYRLGFELKSALLAVLDQAEKWSVGTWMVLLDAMMFSGFSSDGPLQGQEAQFIEKLNKTLSRRYPPARVLLHVTDCVASVGKHAQAREGFLALLDAWQRYPASWRHRLRISLATWMKRLGGCF